MNIKAAGMMRFRTCKMNAAEGSVGPANVSIFETS
jgi:hypothetical protein